MGHIDLKRVADRFPTIYITLISVLLAIAMEDTVSQLRDGEAGDWFNWAIAFYVGMTSFSAWTGYSFVAIVQQRRPRLLDSVNVFAIAAGMIAINTTIDQAHFWFFFSVAIYCLIAIYAIYYNFNMLGEAAPYELQFRDWAVCLFQPLPYFFIYAPLAWLAYQGALDPEVEIAFAYFALTQPATWAVLFYHAWKRVLDHAAQVQAGKVTV
jgi:hypothetical protein